jgi:dipeptidyl aminopeptidase/acylaminoacyl peptidase
MRHLARAGVLLYAVTAASVPAASAQAPPATQAAVVPVPSNLKADGIPPIPASISDALAPYGSSRRALMLGWHPSRREVLIWTAFGDVGQIHAVAGPGMDRRQLTFFREGVSVPPPGSTIAWYDPSGSYFVFAKDAGGGGETTQLFRYDRATAKSTLLTDGKSRNGAPAWSHRSGLIAFESTRRNGKDRDLYVMDPTSPASTRLVTQMEGSWTVAEWSPDDRELLAVNAPAGNTETSLWLVDVKSGEKKRLSPAGAPAVWRAPQYSHDGRSVYVLSNSGSEVLRLWRGDIASGSWKAITSEEDALESFALSPAGRTIASFYDSTTSSRVELLDRATLAVRAAPKLPAGQILTTPQWRPDSGEVAFSLWSLRTFGDVYSVNARTGAVDRWTRSEFGAFNPDSLPEPEIVQWKSFDGLTISGILYRPPARFTGPRPVIINIHGGPGGSTSRERPRYQGRSAYFLNELGIAILAPNVRGSWGFGKAFGRLDDGMNREDAVKDIGALLDWIAAQPALDKDRILVTGTSYGGYMTYAVAEAYANRIRCAVAASAISNFISYFERTDPGRAEDRRVEYGDERVPEMREFLTRISPVTQASKLRVPLMIVHGRKDTRVPVDQAEDMARTVRANGVPVWLAVYEDEGHVMWASQANNNFFFYTWIQFVQQYLLNP